MSFMMAISTAKGMEENMLYSFDLPATPSQLQFKLMALIRWKQGKLLIVTLRGNRDNSK